MTLCQMELRAEGEPYPRTCAICGKSKTCFRHGGDLPPKSAGLTRDQRHAIMRELAERCLSHMGQQDFQIVLGDCHAAARAIKELLDEK